MRTYKLYIRLGKIEPDAAYTVNEDGSMTSFVFDENNSDYQEFVQWCEQGNTPLPADSVASTQEEDINAV
jgi:hypothetical protein